MAKTPPALRPYRLGGQSSTEPQSKTPTGCPSGFMDEEESRQRPTLPPGDPGSTIGAGGLNGRVRNGNGCDPSAMVTGIKLSKMTPEDSERDIEHVKRRQCSFSSSTNVMVKPHDRLVPVSSK